MVCPPQNPVYAVLGRLAAAAFASLWSTAICVAETPVEPRPRVTRSTLVRFESSCTTLRDPLGLQVAVPRSIVADGAQVSLVPRFDDEPGLIPIAPSEPLIAVADLVAAAERDAVGPNEEARRLQAELLQEFTLFSPSLTTWRRVVIDADAPIYIAPITDDVRRERLEKTSTSKLGQLQGEPYKAEEIAGWTDRQRAIADQYIARRHSTRYVPTRSARLQDGGTVTIPIGPLAAFVPAGKGMMLNERRSIGSIRAAAPRTAMLSQPLDPVSFAARGGTVRYVDDPFAPRTGSIRPDVIDPDGLGDRFGPRAERHARRLLLLDGPNRKLFLDEIDADAAALLALLPVSERLRETRAEILYRRGRAIGYRDLPDVVAIATDYDPKRNDRLFDATFAELDSLVDTTRADFYLLRVRSLRRDGRLLEALDLLLANSRLGQGSLTDKKRRDLCRELGWESLWRLMALHFRVCHEIGIDREVPRPR